MFRDVGPLVVPAITAVVGASARRSSQGNVVIQNLQGWGYAGQILPIHPTAPEIDGLPAFGTTAALPQGVDTAIVAVPAADVLQVLRELDSAGVRSANVFTSGFSSQEETEFRAFAANTTMSINGPNCMGLVNFTNAAPLYPSRPSLRLKAGSIALIAQSGSAAISVMNTLTHGLSKVITVGSEFQVTAADYLAWLAQDEATRVVGVVAESIKDPVAFAEAAGHLHAAGKPLIVLKVGNSAVGSLATQAHTGALVSNRDAMDCFFRACDIAVVSDYDELVAALECAATVPHAKSAGAVAIAGISGGQTALACDIAESLGIQLASFSKTTQAAVQTALPGSSGHNPIDIGATVQEARRDAAAAIGAILADADVGALALLQDCQASLNPRTLENYMRHIPGYGALGKSANKPVVVISPTGESLHEGILSALEGTGVPVLRGLREGLTAITNLAKGQAGSAAAWARTHRRDLATENSDVAKWRHELRQGGSSVTPQLCFRILHSYGIPVVKSLVASSLGEALTRASEIGFPMVVKVASHQIIHRSDVGGVIVGIRDINHLTEAINAIADSVARLAPHARIDGFELQEQVDGDLEAMAGFAAAAPFSSLMMIGTGGTLVELMGDRAVELAPVSPKRAIDLIRSTRLGKRLDGYRNLLPKTGLEPLAHVLAALSRLAWDLGDVIAACDLNPILIRKGTGEVRVVDALMITRH